MSHFTTVKTKITDQEALVAALEDLGYRTVRGETVIRGWRQATERVDVAARLGAFDIGFRRGADGTYDAVADWWGVRTYEGVSQSEFMRRVTQRYAYHKVLSEARRRGYALVEEEVQPDQSIRLVVRKWS
ncbi:MAG TPA: DUF1257 domain-containing protein [Thermodesulfobacteriota bacterium]|nr:DUF1257 domain-containing protein [Thermodesulfobacteriota bacterium]